MVQLQQHPDYLLLYLSSNAAQSPDVKSQEMNSEPEHDTEQCGV
jgi:hypothetical protein